MTEDQTHLPWRDGIPTRPDVDALLKAYPVENLIVGTRISDSSIAEVIGDSNSKRFFTVCNVWCKRLQRDHKVTLFREKMTGYFVPFPEEVMAKTHPTLKHVGSTVGKQIRNLSAINPVNDTQRDSVEHQGRLLGHIKREAKKSRMNILPPAKPMDAPQISPPNRKKLN